MSIQEHVNTVKETIAAAARAAEWAAPLAAERPLSVSTSAARLKTPLPRLTEPPVIEPPRLITCPSSVTIRKAI